MKGKGISSAVCDILLTVLQNIGEKCKFANFRSLESQFA
jgi:hypothetical protein